MMRRFVSSSTAEAVVLAAAKNAVIRSLLKVDIMLQKFVDVEARIW